MVESTRQPLFKGRAAARFRLNGASAAAAAALFLFFCGGLAAQNLYISNMDVWFRSAGGGYCSDVDASITVPIINSGPVSGTLPGVDDGWTNNGIITGTRYLDAAGADGACTQGGATAVSATSISGVYSGSTMNGTLNGFDDYAGGTVTGSVYGHPTGSVALAGTMHCIPTVVGPAAEGFEGGNLTATGFDWRSQGTVGWGAQMGTVFAGSYSAASGNISDNQFSALSVGLHITTAGNVRFRYAIDSEAGYDYLRFYIDGVLQDEWDGVIPWTLSLNYPVGTGIHNFRWVYSKDGSNSTVADAAWLDSITFPPNSGIYNGTNLLSTATVTGVVNGVGDNSGNIVAPLSVDDVITGPLTCTAGLPVCTPGNYRWVSSTPGNDRARGTVTGSVTGMPAGPDTRVSFYKGLTGEMWGDSSLIQYERPRGTYPGSCLGLCASILCVVGSTPAVFGIDDLTFEVFKFGAGSNPLDPSSTPPIKTMSLYNIGTCDSAATTPPNVYGSQIRIGTFCAAWDGFYNLNGFFGKTNGLYGYRAKVTTRQTTDQGASIDIEQTAAFPGQNQIPIQVDVTNIHMVQSSPTPVGNLTRVPAQPYNLKYRLSKDATSTITIWDTDVSHHQGNGMALVRTIVSSQPRIGEGVPDGILANGDFWDGRNSSGTIVPAGSYLARIEAGSNDTWPGNDLAWPATIQLALDPLQITDVGIKPLGAASTDMATISFLLTEAATAYVEIYTPGTQFLDTNVSPPVLFSGALLRRYKSQEPGRQSTNAYWDGRDQNGVPLCDGDYVYAIYAELPSVGCIGNHGYCWNSVKTRRTIVGTIPVARGAVLAFLSPSSSVIGSSPTAAGLNPFYFTYTPSRNAPVTLNIKDMDGGIIKTLVNDEIRFANVRNNEIWDGKRNDGTYVSSGNYLAELITTDPYVCATQATSSMTVMFPVHMFRAVDVRTAPLLGGASAYAAVSFELSQPMYMDLKVYPVNTVITPSVWPPTLTTVPVYSNQGLRPGRMRINEPWDGRDSNTNQMVQDGRYPFTVVAHTTGTTQVMYVTDKVYGYLDVSRGQILFSNFEVYPDIPNMYNSSGTINLPPYGIESAVTRQSSVTVQVINTAYPIPDVYAELVTGEVRDGEILYKDFWDGKCTKTTKCFHTDYAPRGTYYIRIMAQDLGLEIKPRTTVQQLIEFSPIRIFDLSIAPLTAGNPAAVSYQLSEPMKVATKIYKPGTNLSDPNNDPKDSLVKLIVGMRPARTQISEYWDGTDFTLSKVPDGNYVFKVYGSTVTGNINTLDGKAVNPALLSEDIIINNIPVIKEASVDLCGDFARQSYFAPNPYTGTTGWFNIPVITNGMTALSIYNLSGDLVYQKDYGLRAIGSDINGNGMCANNPAYEACWRKVNNSGRTVSPGVYFAVLRFESTEGTRGICQVVKKILIP